jgi:CDP-diacylglycerol--glycerol-3-phosphate 3-phosphatidyltransferase
MNLPNLLTLLRIFFVPLLVAALLAEGFYGTWVRLVPRELFALGIFLVAAATDLMDGYLARRWKQVTTVGTLLDPIADKVADLGRADIAGGNPAGSGLDGDSDHRPGFAVTGLRSIAASSGYTIHASDLGKTKMVTQVAAIALVIGGIRWPQLAAYGQLAMWAVVIFGFVSAAAYFAKFWRKVDEGVKMRRRRELLRFERQQKRAQAAMAAAAPQCGNSS